MTRFYSFKAAKASRAAIEAIAQLAAHASSLMTVVETIFLAVQLTEGGGLGASAIDPLHLLVMVRGWV